MSYNDRQIEEYPKYCPNLKKIFVSKDSVLYNDDKEFLPKLEIINRSFVIMYNEDVFGLKILSNKYSQTMKTLDVWLAEHNKENMKTCIDCISRFENLTQLTFIISDCDTTKPIDESLSLIGQKCNKLLKLDLSIDKSIPISDQIFDSLSEFKAIKKMKITLWHKTVLSGSVECFKHCKQLKDLYIRYFQLNEDFFANISSFVPKLQSLEITTNKQYSDSFIDSFQSMKYIQKVKLSVNLSDFTTLYSKSRYFGKYSIKQI